MYNNVNLQLYFNYSEFYSSIYKKDIRRIANSLFKAQKAPLPEMNFGNSADINRLLSLVEDIILKQNRVTQEFYDDSKKKERSLNLSLGSVDLNGMLPSCLT